MELQRRNEKFDSIFRTYLGQRERQKDVIDAFDDDIALLHQVLCLCDLDLRSSLQERLSPSQNVFFKEKELCCTSLMDLFKNTLLLRIEEEISPSPGGNRTHDLSVMRRALYRCATSADHHLTSCYLSFLLSC